MAFTYTNLDNNKKYLIEKVSLSMVDNSIDFVFYRKTKAGKLTANSDLQDNKIEYNGEEIKSISAIAIDKKTKQEYLVSNFTLVDGTWISNLSVCTKKLFKYTHQIGLDYKTRTASDFIIKLTTSNKEPIVYR